MEKLFYLYGLTGVLFYSVLAPMTRKMALAEVPPFSFIAVTMFFLCLYAAIASVLFEPQFSLSSIGWNKLLYLAVFGFLNFIGFFFYVKSVSVIPAVHYQLLMLLTPVFGSAFAYLLLKEALDARMIVGFFVMCAGLLIALSRKIFSE